jgi:sulfonate transport system ATP-binding protein
MVAIARSHAQSVSVRGLTRRFNGHVVLDRLELDIQPGEFVALLGHSGSGKSTLLRALAGLADGSVGTGSIRVPANVSVVFQDSRLLPWKNLIENVTLGIADDRKSDGRNILAEVGLGGRERSWPKELSGGEQQRVALARSLIREPELLLADEPFGALDALTRIKMHELLLQLIDKYHPSVLLVTHDVDEAIKLADRVIVLDAGKISLERQITSPRQIEDHMREFAELRQELLAALGVNSKRSHLVQAA